MALTVAQREARAARQAASDRTHDKYVQRQYGLAEGQYAVMLAEQDGRCAICMNRAGARRLAVDHDHQTNIVRSLLCGRCNKALGQFEFSLHAASNAAQYLLAIVEAHERIRNDSPGGSRPLLN